MSQEPKTDWQPSAGLQSIRARASLYAQIRQFFAQRDILEVETPLLGKSNSLDINLQPFSVAKDVKTTLWLQTSPEFFMKRLLGAGSGSIYQIAKAFRNEEYGRLHNPEFSMLEWYTVGVGLQELIAQVDALLNTVLDTKPAKTISYQSLFEAFHLNPHVDSSEDCIGTAKSKGAPQGLNHEQSCDYLFDLGLHQLSNDSVWVVTDFPIWQAALAKIDHQGPFPIAKRFEFYYKGFELANGYDELTCSDEQQYRFDAENEQRLAMGKPQLPIDDKFLEALNSMPECCGVAVGLDRVLMLQLGLKDIREVISFGYEYL